MRTIAKFVFLILLFVTLPALPRNVDSLKSELNKANGVQRLNIAEQLSAFYARSNPDLALSYDSISLQIAKELNNTLAQSNILNNMGLSYYAKSDYAKAIDLILQSLSLKEKIGDSIEIVKSMNNLGALYQMIGDFDKAIELISRSLEIRRHRNDSAGIARTLNNISVIYNKAGQSEMALEQLNEALLIYKYLKNNDGIASVYNNMGTVYQKLEKHDSAQKYFLLSLGLRDETIDARSAANTYNNLGMVAQARGDFEKALGHYQKALEIRTAITDRFGLVTVQLNLGALHRLMANYQKSEQLLLSALSIAKSENLKEPLQRCLVELSLLYAELKRFDEAYRFSKQALAYKDTIYNDELGKRIAELDNQRKTELTYREKEILRIDNELKTLMIKRKNINFTLSVIFSFLAMVVVYLIWIRLKEKQRLNKSLHETIKQLSISQESLKQANITKDKLFSIIAHDLSSPFNSILGFSDLLKSEAKHLDANDIEEYATHINSAAHQTHQLLKNLLAWASMKQDRMDFKPVKMKLFEAGNDIIQLLDNNAKQKNIKSDNRIPEDLTVNADPDMLHSILRNLVSNAIKFTPAGGWLELSATESPAEVIVSVKDNGIGISEQNIALLFDVEKNFTMPGTANEKGTGLGLVLCKEFVEKHEGRIWVESQKGKGSVFFFSMPSR
jgi:signal transduction histidine kinase/Tfp pilus assembly protein PilF